MSGSNSTKTIEERGYECGKGGIVAGVLSIFACGYFIVKSLALGT